MKARAASYDLANETSSADETATAPDTIESAVAPPLERDIVGQKTKTVQAKAETTSAKSELTRLKQKNFDDMNTLRREDASSFTNSNLKHHQPRETFNKTKSKAFSSIIITFLTRFRQVMKLVLERIAQLHPLLLQ